eukprot:3472459-Rhodomonas_salina.1
MSKSRLLELVELGLGVAGRGERWRSLGICACRQPYPGAFAVASRAAPLPLSWRCAENQPRDQTRLFVLEVPHPATVPLMSRTREK